MALLQGFLQVGDLYLGVNGGGVEIGVPQQGLKTAKIGSPSQQMSGASVSKLMKPRHRSDAGFFGVVADGQQQFMMAARTLLRPSQHLPSRLDRLLPTLHQIVPRQSEND